MNNKVLGMLFIAVLCLVPLTAMPQAPTLKKLEDTVEGRLRSGQTTLEDQTDMAVTVYNNRALVRDRRSIKMLPGETALRFMDVASKTLRLRQSARVP